MSDYAPVPVGKDEKFGDLLHEFLSVADGSTFNVCAGLYEIILKADKEEQAHLFEKAINLYKKLGFVEYKRDANIGIYNNKNIDDIYMKLNK